MRKSAGKMFVMGFLKSFFIILVFVGVGVFSYQTVMHYWKAPDTKTVEIFKEQEPESITKVSIDDVSKNLIYCIDEETGEISKILLEIFHCKNKKLYYITIPVRTQFTMTDSLYRRLVPVNPAIPQIIKLSGIAKYFEKDFVYDYGVLMVEDLLKIKISYYTVVPQSVYETIFVTEDIISDEIEQNKTELAITTGEEDIGEGKEEVGQIIMPGTVPKEIFSEDYITFLKTIKTAEDLSNYIEDIYSSIQSNLTLLEKMNYFESYCNTPQSNILFELISGIDQNSAYIVDTELANQQIADCMAEPVGK